MSHLQVMMSRYLWKVDYPRHVSKPFAAYVCLNPEESGNMVIMTLSYYQRTGDSSLMTTYFDLLDQWTQFLITDALIPENQISTDDFAGSLANQTNLAIKGIVGIKAMAEIASIVGDTARSSNYSSIAASYVPQWQQFATSSDGKHLTLSYGNDSSWGLSYNMFADVLLNTSVFPASVYDMQTAWYSTVVNEFGVPLDTRHTYTKSDWQSWTAALVTSTTMRDTFINSVYKYAADEENSQPLGDWYETLNGDVESFRARPVVGGHLASLALQAVRSDEGSIPANIGGSGLTESPNSGSAFTTRSASGKSGAAAGAGLVAAVLA